MPKAFILQFPFYYQKNQDRSKPGLVDDALSVFGFLFGFLFHKWYQNNVASKYLIEYEVKLRKCAV